MIDEQYLTRVLARLAEQTVERRVRPPALVTGVVESAAPLSVKLSDSITLPADALITDDRFRVLTFETTEGGDPAHTHTITWDNSLKAGDRVRLISGTGGQVYYILGRA